MILVDEDIHREFRHSGEQPHAATFKISDVEGESVVNKFYGIEDMKGNLDRVFEILDGELPEGFISIGDDPAGNEICIGINEKYYGKIYLCIHDMELDDELSNMFFLAESFNEFFNSLYEN